MKRLRRIFLLGSDFWLSDVRFIAVRNHVLRQFGRRDVLEAFAAPLGIFRFQMLIEPIDQGTGPNFDLLVSHVADHARVFHHANGMGANGARDCTKNTQCVDDDFAFDSACYTYGEGFATDIAVNAAFYLNFSIAFEIANNVEIGADD